MKILFIGGTGKISTAISRHLIETGHELYLLNRGNRKGIFSENAHQIIADISNEEDVRKKIADMTFDSVCDFIAYRPEQVERDYRLFNGKTKQYIYISSASAYNKPCASYIITEGTTLANPYWEYSRNKIACEEFLMKKYREENFPVTIVRPSHTYDERSVPVGIHGKNGSWQILERIKKGKPVLIQGDGTSLWTITFNSDFAKGFTGLIGNIHALGEAFQITSDETLTWNQIYEIIASSLGVKLNAYHVASDFLAAVDKNGFDLEGSLLGDKAHSIVFENSKLKKVVPDFVCTVSASEGLKRTVEYMCSHAECQIPDPEFDEWTDKVIDALEAAKKQF